MKRRSGFGKIVIDGNIFQFNWARTVAGPMLVMYDDGGYKLEIPHYIWNKYSHSNEYLTGEQTWHGKHKNGAEFGCWGKREAREMYRKYQRYMVENHSNV